MCLGKGRSDFAFAEILAILLPLLGVVAYLTLAERKVIASMQLRKGYFLNLV